VDSIQKSVWDTAKTSQSAAWALATASRAQKDDALNLMSKYLKQDLDFIVDENKKDLATAEENKLDPKLIDRLMLNEERVKELSDALIAIAQLSDPVGEVIRGWVQPNGLKIEQVRVPLGVVGIIYEARPNVTVDAAAICLKSGNAVLLRGSASAKNTNHALVSVLQKALAASGIPEAAIQMVPGDTHESVKHLMNARGLVDVLIPRGGASLIQSVVRDSTVPVIETGIGNCHVYVDASADVEMATNIILNAKVQRCTVCNAAETLLVHKDIAEKFLPIALEKLKNSGVTLHVSSNFESFAKQSGINFEKATDNDWAAEYYTLDLAAKIVDDIDEAISHIRTWSSHHTEAIVTNSVESTQKFIAQVDSAAVMVNASTRFTDGGEFGFGAEMGISNQKLHARGPMGLTEMTSSKYIVTGNGQIRE
jgi:glutamate-5-semialdehyde dehydrogenase